MNYLLIHYMITHNLNVKHINLLILENNYFHGISILFFFASASS